MSAKEKQDKEKRKIRAFQGDRPLWIVVAILCVVSLLVIYSSTASMAYRDAGGDTSRYLIKHIIMISVGMGGAIFIHLIDPPFILKWVKFFLYASITMAILAYTPWFSSTRNDASRWFQFPGIGFTVLTSAPLQVSLVMYLAVALGRRQAVIDKILILPSFRPSDWKRNKRQQHDILFRQTLPIVFPIVISVLVILFANLSTAAIIFFISMVVLLVGRVKRREVMRLITALGVGFVAIVLVMYLFGVGRAATWIGRVESYISPVVGLVSQADDKEHVDEFQKTEAKVAIASGGIIGKGPGKSTQRSTLPHPYSDFAYAFIIEEYGLFGAIVILTLYLWILYRSGMIVRKCENPTYNIVVIGLTAVIITPAFVNMLVSTGVVPVTGQSLPLISLGGSSVIVTSGSFGIILGISRYSDKQGRIKRAKEKRERELTEKEVVIASIVEAEQVHEENATPHVPRGTILDTKPTEQDDKDDEDDVFGVREGETSEPQTSEKEVFELY